MTAPVFPVYAHVSRVEGPPQGQWTRADWEALPDDGNSYEVIDGVLYRSTSPSYFHNWIIKRFYALLGYPAEERGLAYCGLERVSVFMPGCEPVQPDFVVVLAERASMIRERRIYGVPDLIVEVLSPGSADYDEDVKRTVYAQAGVPEYAVIGPKARQLRLYHLEHPGEYSPPQIFNASDTVTFACLPTLPLVVGKLFEGAPDTTL
jgi:Uma2 family endonuclease